MDPKKVGWKIYVFPCSFYVFKSAIVEKGSNKEVFVFMLKVFMIKMNVFKV